MAAVRSDLFMPGEVACALIDGDRADDSALERCPSPPTDAGGDLETEALAEVVEEDPDDNRLTARVLDEQRRSLAAAGACDGYHCNRKPAGRSVKIHSRVGTEDESDAPNARVHGTS